MYIFHDLIPKLKSEQLQQISCGLWGWWWRLDASWWHSMGVRTFLWILNLLVRRYKLFYFYFWQDVCRRISEASEDNELITIFNQVWRLIIFSSHRFKNNYIMYEIHKLVQPIYLFVSAVLQPILITVTSTYLESIFLVWVEWMEHF